MENEGHATSLARRARTVLAALAALAAFSCATAPERAERGIDSATPVPSLEPSAGETAGVVTEAKPASVDAALPTAPVEATSPDAAELSALARAHYADLSERDWTAVAARFLPGATITRARGPTGDVIAGVAAQPVEEFLAEAARRPPAADELVLEVAGEEIAVSRSVGQLLVRYRATSRSPSEVHAWQGTDAFVLLKRDGCWRIASLVVGADALGE